MNNMLRKKKLYFFHLLSAPRKQARAKKLFPSQAKPLQSSPARCCAAAVKAQSCCGLLLHLQATLESCTNHISLGHLVGLTLGYFLSYKSNMTDYFVQLLYFDRGSCLRGVFLFEA